MINFEAIRERADELEKEGVAPEKALAIATAEEIKRTTDAEENAKKQQKALEDLIAEGKREVNKLKELHDKLEADE